MVANGGFLVEEDRRVGREGSNCESDFIVAGSRENRIGEGQGGAVVLAVKVASLECHVLANGCEMAVVAEGRNVQLKFADRVTVEKESGVTISLDRTLRSVIAKKSSWFVSG